jgi:hypothetical protein
MTSYVCERFTGRRSLALIHRCLPSLPRTRPNHSKRRRCSFTHQSSCPARDHVAISTGIGGSTSRRSTPILLEEHPQPFFCVGPILLGIQRSQFGIGSDTRVEAGPSATKAS